MIFLLIFLSVVSKSRSKYQDLPCQWSSFTGSSYDLQPLTAQGDTLSFLIKDGDIPCTSEVEPEYSYVWNFCADVTSGSFPSVCNVGNQAAAIQFINRDDGYQECNAIGFYDAAHDDTHFSLIDINNPAVGVSISYINGARCPDGSTRSATINVYCANVKSEVLTANEPAYCNYHLDMKSYYGCPTECPVTNNGLCNSHGHCYYDTVSKKPYCYCNKGYSGESCQKDSSSSESEGSYTVEIGLLITLLIIAFILVLFVGYMAYQIMEYRKSQLSFTPLREQEMV